jgi:hypothetical protein
VINVIFVNLDKTFSTSPAYSANNQYIFISTTDFASGGAQLTNIYMVQNPLNGAFVILDSVVNIGTHSTFGIPASMVSTNKDTYIPMGEKVKIASIGVNQFVNHQCRDFFSLSSVPGTVCWSASVGILSIDTLTCTICTNTGGEIRRWTPE